MLKSKKVVSGALVLASLLATSTMGQAAKLDTNYYSINENSYNTNVYSNYVYVNYKYSNYSYGNWQVITLPNRPSRPSTPTTPVVPNVPVTPETPVVPNIPVTPEKPVIPENPNVNENPNSSATLSFEELEVVRLVNIERTKMGLVPFTISNSLSDVARLKSQDMATNNYFSHTSPTYGSPFDMMKKFGISYKTAGENIAKGYLSAQSVVNGWMNSAGHKANILNPSFKTIGVGAYKSGNSTIYWTQMFTN